MTIESLQKKVFSMDDAMVESMVLDKDDIGYEKSKNDLPTIKKKGFDQTTNNNNHDNGSLDYKPKNNYVLWTQIIGAVIVSFVHVGIGTTSAFSGIILPQLTDRNSTDLYFEIHEAALFSSIIMAGAMLGSLSSGPLMVIIGQRNVLLMSLPIAFASWLTIALAPSVYVVIVARFVVGSLTGLTSDCCTSYIVEYAHPNVRGKLGAAIDISRQCGYLFVYIIGSTGLSWRNVAYICGTLSTIIPFFGLLTLPNAPRWLATKGRFDESKKSLTFYRGKKYDVDQEMTEIRDELAQSNGTGSILGQVKQIMNRSVGFRILLVAFIMFSIPFNGNFIVVGYSIVIFQSANTGLDIYMCTIIMGIVRVLGSVSFVLMGERLKRRTLFFTCYSICAASLIILGIYFYVAHLGYDVSNVSWLPLVTLIVFMYCVALSSPALSMFRSELIPNSVRAMGVGICTVALFSGAFICTQTFPTLVNVLGSHGTFWFYSACGIFVVIVAAISVPETKGKSLEEINAKVMSKKSVK